MEISPTAPIAASQQATPQAARQPQPAPEEVARQTLEPAPGLRPNIQDYVDINRTLLALRKM